MDENISKEYHKHTIKNRTEIEHSKMCGCASCCNIYPATDIVDFYNDVQGETAVCPECGVDAVIGDACGLPINEKVLEELYKDWFCDMEEMLKMENE